MPTLYIPVCICGSVLPHHSGAIEIFILIIFACHHLDLGTETLEQATNKKIKPYLTRIKVMAHIICAKILRTYTLSRSTARAARNKVQVSYVEIIVIEFATIWARWLTHPAEINATRVGFPSGDLGLIVCVLLAKQVTRVRFSFFDLVC